MSDLKQEILDSLARPLLEAFEAEGMTIQYLAKKLRAELNAKEIKVFKGTMETGGNKSDVILYSKQVVAWEIRQRARMDAHKIRGDYPDPKLGLEHSGPGGSREIICRWINDIANNNDPV